LIIEGRHNFAHDYSRSGEQVYYRVRPTLSAGFGFLAVTVDRARELRRNSTAAEKRLWQLLRSRQFGGAKFRRQHPVGAFVVDFACVEQRVILEADGGQHAGSDADVRWTAWLEAEGWRVIRFWNNEILENPEGVLARIETALGGTLRRAPSPSQR
jgi:very-short-patch-repair endonuclease